MKKRTRVRLKLIRLVMPVLLWAPSAAWPASQTAPKIYYSDVTSAPAQGFVCAYGRNLGSSRGSSSVYFDGLARSNGAASYVSWGPAIRGTAEQQVCVKVPSSGTVNGIVIVVGGVPSNVVPFARHSGSTYWVTKSGRDSNSCTSEGSACLTLRGAANKISAGDVVLVRAGTYDTEDGTSPNPILYYSSSRGDPSGTASQPVTFRGYPGDTVTVRNDGTVSCGNSFYIGRDYVQIVNFVTTSNDTSDYGDHNRWVNNHFKDANHDGCRTSGPRGQGLFLSNGCSGAIVYGNTVSNNGTTSLDHGLYVEGTNASIAYNAIHDNAGYGVHGFKSGSTAVDGNTVHGNRIYNNGKAGILLGSGDGNVAYNNIVYENAQYGIEIGYGTVTATEVFNNTLYSNDGDCVVVQSSGSVSGTDVRNNICYRNGRDSIANKGSGTILSGNLLGTNPQFVVAGSDFHLASGSPARDNADSGLAPADDSEVNARPYGSGVDVGAFEYYDPGTGTDPPPQAVQNVRRSDSK